MRKPIGVASLYDLASDVQVTIVICDDGAVFDKALGNFGAAYGWNERDPIPGTRRASELQPESDSSPDETESP